MFFSSGNSNVIHLCNTAFPRVENGFMVVMSNQQEDKKLKTNSHVNDVYIFTARVYL